MSVQGHLTSVASAAAQDAIRLAVEIELGGMAFHAQAAAAADGPMLKALFEKFAAMEKEHMATLSRRYHVDVPAPSDGFVIERAAMYAGIPHRPQDPANLFRIAIAFEERTVRFFTERQGHCPEGSVERQLYRELAAEEREHVDTLTTEFTRWRTGKPDLLSRECRTGRRKQETGDQNGSSFPGSAAVAPSPSVAALHAAASQIPGFLFPASGSSTQRHQGLASSPLHDEPFADEANDNRRAAQASSGCVSQRSKPAAAPCRPAHPAKRDARARSQAAPHRSNAKRVGLEVIAHDTVLEAHDPGLIRGPGVRR